MTLRIVIRCNDSFLSPPCLPHPMTHTILHHEMTTRLSNNKISNVQTTNVAMSVLPNDNAIPTTTSDQLTPPHSTSSRTPSNNPFPAIPTLNPTANLLLHHTSNLPPHLLQQPPQLQNPSFHLSPLSPPPPMATTGQTSQAHSARGPCHLPCSKAPLLNPNMPHPTPSRFPTTPPAPSPARASLPPRASRPSLAGPSHFPRRPQIQLRSSRWSQTQVRRGRSPRVLQQSRQTHSMLSQV